MDQAVPRPRDDEPLIGPGDLTEGMLWLEPRPDQLGIDRSVLLSDRTIPIIDREATLTPSKTQVAIERGASSPLANSSS